MADRERLRRRSTSREDDAVADASYIAKPSDDKLIDPAVEKLLDKLEPSLSIDENALDEALIEQPDFYFRVSRELALQTSRRDASKQYTANVEARVDAHIRRSVREREDKKTTEPEIKAQIRVHVDTVRANEEYLRLCHGVMQLTALKESFQQRSYALKSLVELHLAGYFTSASHSSATNSMKEERGQLARAALAEERRKRERSE